MRRVIFLLATLLTISLFIGSCNIHSVPNLPQSKKTVNKGATISEHLQMGNPSKATTNVTNNNNYLMVKPQYALSYSRDRGIPNWVSWHLDKSWIGNVQRQNNFRSDETLPSDWYRVETSDYTGSGFDRGHNCPSGDRTNTIENNAATFLMTNMIPQAPQNNQETWANLEEYCRSLVEEGNELYIIMGSYGQGGTGNNGAKSTLAGGKVTVPNRVWKVVVVLPEGSNDISRITTTTRVIAINTPNSNSVNSNWGSYRVSVDQIEKATGYDLLSTIPANIQEAIEAKVDKGPTQ